MIPWVLVATASIPGGGGEIRLRRRGTEFSIDLGAITLMNSRLSGSEKALAVETCRRLAGCAAPKVLIGGLGMGFTLRAALAALESGAEITVSELVPAVIAWAHGPLAEVFGDSLSDPRVAVVQGDVGRMIAARAGFYDAIILDVDNGPAGLTREGNDALYGSRGLGAARRALAPGGLLAVWSVEPNEAFAARMGKAGFKVEDIRVHAHAGRGARHVIWIGRRP